MRKAFELWGGAPEIEDRQQVKNVRVCWLKDNSIGKVLSLRFHHHSKQKLLIKLEIDTNPPAGSQELLKFLDFPIDVGVMTQDLPSNFAGKCHALLYRDYVKGRDLFDLLWYLKQKVVPNLTLLSNALRQKGPWQDQALNCTEEWLLAALSERIQHMDWSQAVKDVVRFVKPPDDAALKHWSPAFFLEKLKPMQERAELKQRFQEAYHFSRKQEIRC